MEKIRKSISYILYWFGLTIQFSKLDISDFEKIKKTLLPFRQNGDLASYSHMLNKKKHRRLLIVFDL